jgi:hypothetical protein
MIKDIERLINNKNKLQEVIQSEKNFNAKNVHQAINSSETDKSRE